MASSSLTIPKAIHPWLWNISLSYVPGPTTPVLDEFTRSLLEAFQRGGHKVTSSPERDTQVLFTSAHLGEPLNWREAMLFTARRRFQLEQAPMVFTFLHATP